MAVKFWRQQARVNQGLAEANTTYNIPAAVEVKVATVEIVAVAATVAAAVSVWQ